MGRSFMRLSSAALLKREKKDSSALALGSTAIWMRFRFTRPFLYAGGSRGFVPRDRAQHGYDLDRHLPRAVIIGLLFIPGAPSVDTTRTRALSPYT